MLSLSSVSELQGRTYYQQENYYAKEDSQQYSRWAGKGAELIGLVGDIRFLEFDRLIRGWSPDGSEIWSKFQKQKSKELHPLAIHSVKTSLFAILQRAGLREGLREKILIVAAERLEKGRPTAQGIQAIANKIHATMKKDGSVPTSAMLAVKKEIRDQLGTIKAYPSRRAGLDITLSAPKSVSMQALIFGDKRLLLAHRQAVAETLRVIEDRYSQYRGGTKKERTMETAGKLLISQFEHDTSREMDPQLHTHNLVLNLVPTKEGDWKALSNEQIYRNKVLLGLIYQNEFARQCRELGYETITSANGTFEIRGFSREHIEVFSKRRLQMEALGISSSKDAEAKALVNRKPKGPEQPREELRRQWEAEAKDNGISRVEPATIEKPVQTLVQALQSGILQVSERDVKFTLESLEKAILANSLGRFTYKEIRQEALRRIGTEIIETTKPGVYTSFHALAIERETRELAGQAKGTAKRLMTDFEAAVHIQAIGPHFNSGQAGALRAVLTTDDAVSLWHGVAGAGKTTALRQLAETLRQKGYDVEGFASSAEAAKVLGEGAAIGSRTLARLLMTNQPVPEARPFWIVDEASLVSARDMQKLLKLRVAHDARLLIVGDTRQLSSVEAGAPFRDLRSILQTSELDQSVRQANEILKEAVALMNRGDVQKGLLTIDQSIIETGTAKRRAKAVAAEFLGRDLNRREDTLVITRTNLERSEVTGLIREGLKAQGVLHNSARVPVFENIDLPGERLRFAASAEIGDLLVPYRSVDKLGLRKHEGYEVLGKDTIHDHLLIKNRLGETVRLSLKAHSEHSLFRPRELELAEGDRLIWTRNQYDQNRLNNDLVRVVQIKDGTASLQRENGRIETVDLSQRQFLDHAWVLTVNKSQGLTIPEVIGSADSKTSKESLYVMTTRASQDVKLFCDDKESLYAIAEKSGANQTATEMVADVMKLFDKMMGWASEKAPEKHLEKAPEMQPEQDKEQEVFGGLEL